MGSHLQKLKLRETLQTSTQCEPSLPLFCFLGRKRGLYHIFLWTSPRITEGEQNTGQFVKFALSQIPGRLLCLQNVGLSHSWENPATTRYNNLSCQNFISLVFFLSLLVAACLQTPNFFHCIQQITAFPGRQQGRLPVLCFCRYDLIYLNVLSPIMHIEPVLYKGGLSPLAL